MHTATNINSPTHVCGQDFLDLQDRVSYASPHKKEVLINKR